MTLLALAPLPLGSNRPVFWALSAVLVGIIATLYYTSVARRGGTSHGTPGWRVAMGLGLLYLGWTVVQIMPLGALFGGFEVVLPSGLIVQINSLSLTPGPSTLAAIRMASYGMFFWLMLEIAAKRNHAKRFAAMLFSIVTAWAIYGMLALVQFGDTILLFEKWAYLGSVTGPFVNRNSFATFLAMGLIVGLGLAADQATRMRPPRTKSAIAHLTEIHSLQLYVLIIASLLVLATLVQTNSRMGVFAGLIGAGLTVTLILSRRLGLGPRTWLVMPPMLLVAGGLVTWIYGGVLFERLGGVGQDANIRLEAYRQILGMIAQRPWTGWGADSFEVIFRAFRAPPVSLELSWQRAHSTYLTHWVESGVLFGSVPIILTGWAFVACLIAAIRREKDIVMPAIGAGVIATGAVHSLVDFSLEIQANVWLFLALVALAIGGHIGGHGSSGHRAGGRDLKTYSSTASTSADAGHTDIPRKRRRRHR